MTNTRDASGLLASGSSDSWDVAIEESLSEESRWIGEIDGPRVYLAFEVGDPRVFEQAVRFLGIRPSEESPRSHPDPLVLGTFDGSPLSLVWDDEDFLRCFLIVGGGAGSALRIAFHEEEIASLRAALEEAVASL